MEQMFVNMHFENFSNFERQHLWASALGRSPSKCFKISRIWISNAFCLNTVKDYLPLVVFRHQHSQHTTNRITVNAIYRRNPDWKKSSPIPKKFVSVRLINAR